MGPRYCLATVRVDPSTGFDLDAPRSSTAALKGRQFVFILVLLIPNDLLFQKAPGQILAPDAERDRQTEHEGSEGDPEGDEHGLFRQTQLFESDRQYESKNDAANSKTQNPG